MVRGGCPPGSDGAPPVGSVRGAPPAARPAGQRLLLRPPRSLPPRGPRAVAPPRRRHARPGATDPHGMTLSSPLVSCLGLYSCRG